MPNHIENVLKVAGPGAFTAMQRYFCMIDDDETGKPFGPALDFNVLIPMPEATRKVIENGTGADVLTLLAEAGDIAGTWERLRKFDHKGEMGPWKGLIGFEQGEIPSRLEKAFPGCIANARMMARSIGETGFKSWYDWSIANWGTKWNAYTSSLAGEGDFAELKFQTAWSMPVPFLEALAKAEQALSFQYWAFDEGWNFYGVGLGAGGSITVENQRNPQRGDARAHEVYRICYGEEPEWDEEEGVA